MLHSFILLLILFPSVLIAQDFPRHMVQITNKGLGAGAGYERTYPRDESNFRDFDITRGNFDANYAYTIKPRWQIGGLISSHSEKRTYQTKAGQKGRVAYYNNLFGISLYWNAQRDLFNSWYVGFLFSVLNHEEEFSKNVFTFLEDDKNAETYELSIGKRFSLNGLGLANITYSPSLSLYAQRARKDYDDDGLQDNVALNIEVIKFDVLF